MVPSKSLIYQREQRDLANVFYESIYTQRESREGERETDLTKENVFLLHDVQGERERPSQHFFQNAHAFMQRERERKTWHKRLLLSMSLVRRFTDISNTLATHQQHITTQAPLQQTPLYITHQQHISTIFCFRRTLRGVSPLTTIQTILGSGECVRLFLFNFVYFIQFRVQGSIVVQYFNLLYFILLGYRVVSGSFQTQYLVSQFMLLCKRGN